MKRTTFFTILICSIYVLISILVACTPEPAETLTETETTTLPATIVTETTTPPATTITEVVTLTETETTTLPATIVTETTPAITTTETITVTPLPPILTWVEKPVVEFHSWFDPFVTAWVLTGCTVYQYFEVTNGSGEVEITAAIDTLLYVIIMNGEITNTFFVEEGESYKLLIHVFISTSPEPQSYRFFDITISSPYATSSVEGAFSVSGAWVDTVSLTKMNLEPR